MFFFGLRSWKLEKRISSLHFLVIIVEFHWAICSPMSDNRKRKQQAASKGLNSKKHSSAPTQIFDSEDDDLVLSAMNEAGNDASPPLQAGPSRTVLIPPVGVTPQQVRPPLSSAASCPPPQAKTADRLSTSADID